MQIFLFKGGTHLHSENQIEMWCMPKEINYILAMQYQKRQRASLVENISKRD